MRYENYKSIDLPWLKEIPEHWDAKNVNNIFDERNSKVSDKVFKPLSVTKKGVLPQLENVAKSDDRDNRKQVCIGDFVINSRSDRKGSSGLSLYLGSVSLINTVLTPRIGEGNYWHYLMKSVDFQEEFYRNGKGIVADLWSTKFQAMKNIDLPIPPLTEQIQIAKFLDWKINEIDRLIKAEKEKIRELSSLKKSIISTIVTKGMDKNIVCIDTNLEYIEEVPKHWEIKRIIGVCNIIRGNSAFKKDELLHEGKYVALQYGQIYKINAVDECYKFYVNEEFYRNTQTVNKGDIIFVSTSEVLKDLGHIAFYNRDDIGLVGGEQILLKPFSNINSKYLFYLLKKISGELQKHATGIKVYRFNTNDISNLKVVIPSLDEQKEIVDFLERKIQLISGLFKSTNITIENLKLLKQSLISEVVTGKINVQNIEVPSYDNFELDVIEEGGINDGL